MKSKINVITLAVNDLEKSLAFYRDGLGLSTKGIVGTEFKGSDTEPAGAVAFFEMEGGIMLALYPRSELAKDAKIMDKVKSSLEFSIGYIAEDKEEVDQLIAKARAAGAKITDLPHNRPWVYSGYFEDPDGHLWEIICDPNAAA